MVWGVVPVSGPSDGLSEVGHAGEHATPTGEAGDDGSTPCKRDVLDDILLGADDGEVAVDEHVVRPVDSNHVDFVIAAAQ